MHSDAADLILRSDAIFTAARNELFSGYVVIKNGAIAAMIANGEDIQTWRGERTRFIELGDRLICPGFCDNHTFFTGYMSMQRGVDLHAARNSNHALELLQDAEKLLPE
ncbi:metal-dependent hydrolase, partial [Klebsiella pneumoniae]|nr:metal-dependent hydrolase [Klebsiella pneumoniae]